MFTGWDRARPHPVCLSGRLLRNYRSCYRKCFLMFLAARDAGRRARDLQVRSCHVCSCNLSGARALHRRSCRAGRDPGSSAAPKAELRIRRFAELDMFEFKVILLVCGSKHSLVWEFRSSSAPAADPRTPFGDCPAASSVDL